MPKCFLPALFAACIGVSPALSNDLGGKWISLSADKAFSLRAPAGSSYQPLQGIDSFVGKFSGPGYELEFDYGIYSNSLGELRADPKFETENTRIDGHDAFIVSGPTSSKHDWNCSGYLVGVYVTLPQANALEMHGCTDKEKVDTVKTIFRSLKFS
jgi:hypothetical protein